MYTQREILSKFVCAWHFIEADKCTNEMRTGHSELLCWIHQAGWGEGQILQNYCGGPERQNFEKNSDLRVCASNLSRFGFLGSHSPAGSAPQFGGSRPVRAQLGSKKFSSFVHTISQCEMKSSPQQNMRIFISGSAREKRSSSRSFSAKT